MGLMKVAVVFERLSALPEDQVVNTWYFLSGTIVDPDLPSSAEINDVRDRLVDFYNTGNAGGFSPSDFIADSISRATDAHRMDFYWNEDAEVPTFWGSPIATRTWSLGASTSTVGLPSEVAIVMSYHADLTDVPQTAPDPVDPTKQIRPAARLRGRVFIGPVNGSANAQNVTSEESEVSASAIDGITDAGSRLIVANDTDWSWVVGSGFGTIDDPGHIVVGGWVDNAWDTQRRRGNAASARTTFS